MEEEISDEELRNSADLWFAHYLTDELRRGCFINGAINVMDYAI